MSKPTHLRSDSGHKQIEFICQVCGTPQRKNFTKQHIDVCRVCLLGPCKFQAKAEKIHGTKYRYLLNTYVHSTKVMSIECPVHGIFTQRPSDHIQGQACPECSKASSNFKIRKTEEQFVNQILSIYKSQVDTSKVVYAGPDTAVIIPCPTHGEQLVMPANLMAGYATCKKCLPKYVDTAAFIARANTVHGDRYSYEQTVYRDARTKVVITCPVHGEFTQNPMGHIYGRGCTKCSLRGFNLGKPGYLYYLYIPSVDAYKIGITNLGIEDRYLSYERELFKVLSIRYYEDGSKAKAIESWLIKRYAAFRYTGTNPLNSGRTEMFYRDILGPKKDALIAQGDLIIT